MKNVFILILGLLAGTVSFAQTQPGNAPETSVSITTDQKLKLIVGREETTATITMRDENGHIIYTDKVGLQNGLYQKFDIAQLNEGTYELAISVGNDTVVKSFVIESQPAHKLVAFRS
ncbi:DUF3244 domain-containing protein [Spirosoma endbachense]|uniref:DUF3244 domain-containing protein n=1 Tax=Spirosoma endbachense TaxID=2666025 RepID=A0A6P1WAI4_9BACT|nr:DUF3244 domain-containing protein [Spirosoma endbachense]QHW00901.1 DUF3244 domain-containing protein [Spirosoma endbachense]